MAKDSKLTNNELEELLLKQVKQQPAKCKMKSALKFINKGTVPPADK